MTVDLECGEIESRMTEPASVFRALSSDTYWRKPNEYHAIDRETVSHRIEL
ncbi:MAG: hypothetical protein J07HQX50_00198 [Haloquadratum sp. J07HQX50]|nr:MAG: hypothetical protein J07HQX50_00198 [Haloquadratum sp. J07HQX50]